MKKLLFRLIFCAIFLFSVFCSCIAQENNFTQQMNLFQSSWRHYLHTLKQVQCVVVTDMYHGDKIESTTKNHFDSDYPQTIYSNESNTSILCFNNRYQFSLRRQNNNEDWIIDQIDAIPKPPSIESWNFLPASTNISLAKNGPNSIASITTMGLRLFPTWFPSLCNEPAFEGQNLKKGEEDGFNIVTIQYKFEPNDKTLGDAGRSGEVVLLQDYNYLIKRARFQYFFDQKSNRLGTVEIANEFDLATPFGVPVLTKQTTVFHEDGELYKKIMTFSDYKSTADQSPSRFTLSHYGLPEPDFGEQRVSRLRYVIMGLGLLMIGIGAWRMIQKRRNQS